MKRKRELSCYGGIARAPQSSLDGDESSFVLADRDTIEQMSHTLTQQTELQHDGKGFQATGFMMNCIQRFPRRLYA